MECPSSCSSTEMKRSTDASVPKEYLITSEGSFPNPNMGSIANTTANRGSTSRNVTWMRIGMPQSLPISYDIVIALPPERL